MDVFLKRYFWTVWLVFLAASAWLTARSVNTWVAGAIEPPSALAVAPTSNRAPTAPAATVVDAVKFGRLFGIEPPPPPPSGSAVEAAPEQKGDLCWTCEPVKTNLRLQLLATMVANQKQWSMALISDLDRQVTEYYVVGDRIKNARIHDVIREPQRVIIVNEDTNRLEYVDAVPGAGGGAMSSISGLPNLNKPSPAEDTAADAAGQDDAEDPALAVRQVDENNYVIPQGKLDQTLANLNKVATQARIVPSFKNGVANGFKLFSIRPGSIYSSIGVQNGDVITRINGFDINSPDKALEVYQRLKDARNVEIDIERRGQVIKKRYAIE